jgi:hypothetical protein
MHFVFRIVWTEEMLCHHCFRIGHKKGPRKKDGLLAYADDKDLLGDYIGYVSQNKMQKLY